MQSLYQQLDQLAADRWARTGVRMLLRACWIAACMWCIALGGHLVWGWPLHGGALAVLSLGTIGAALILLLRPRMSRSTVARRLDRRFHLDEQLATAVELAHARPGADSITARLLAESSRTVGLVRKRISHQQAAPWSEVIVLVALLLMLAGLGIMVAIGRPDAGLVGAGLAPLPGLEQPQDQQPPQEPAKPQTGGPQSPTGQQQNQAASSDPQLLAPIADALRDQGATRPAADALDRGDVAGAAQALRELADQAGQLSSESRRNLGAKLRAAADQIQGRNPSLADQLRQSAVGLQRGGSASSKALEDLASALEQNQQAPSDANQQAQGKQGQSGQGQQGQQGQGGGQGGTGLASGEQRQSAPSSRLGVDGKPIELDAQGSGQRAESSGAQPSSAEVVPGTTSGNGSSGTIGAIGADPLRVPVEDRDVIQGYFTP